MTLPDPLQCFSVECASAVFAYLSVSDIARCERVCRGWRAFTGRWIASFGLRLHYPHLMDHPGTLDSESASPMFRSHCEMISPCLRRLYKDVLI
ncbi:hypothetical protein BJX70DRAFT_36945 [Aspergillus crustosus]